MFKSNLVITFRNLMRQRAHTFINIAGLTVGIASFIIVFLFVQKELSYDRFHENSEKIYRIHNTIYLADGGYTYPTCNSILPVLAKAEIPGVRDYVRMFKAGGGFNNEVIVQVGEQFFREPSALFVDSTFFHVFTFELLNGDPDRVLNYPNEAVLTEKTAHKYFGTADVVGKVLKLTGENEMKMKVVGVMRNVPDNSHFDFDLLFSMSTVRNIANAHNFLESWENDGFYSYLLLEDNADVKEVDQAMADLVGRHAEPELQAFLNPDLFPLEHIHLRSNHRNEIQQNGSRQEVLTFIFIAVAILLIASVNYINLTTAVASRRAKEVGVRKVFGASRDNLMRQYLAESLIVALISTLLAPALVEWWLPFFNHLAQKELLIDWFSNIPLMMTLLGITLFIGLVSGIYPAMVLSSFKPIKALRGTSESGENISEGLRKGLVVFQFSISILLVIGGWTAYRQINYLHNKPLGFDKENVVIIRNSNNTLTPKLKSFKQELKANPSVNTVSASFSVPGGLRPILFVNSDYRNDEDALNLAAVNIDFGYFEALGINILEGRDLDPAMATDSTQAILLNKRAVKELGLPESPYGEIIEVDVGDEQPQRRKVIGVVDNINFEPLYRPTEAAMYGLFFPMFTNIIVKIEEDDKDGTIDFLESKWSEYVPGEPFQYTFLEGQLKSLYRGEEKMRSVISLLAILAVFIALLGLYGLSSYSILQRAKEIGIRKVLGASLASIMYLFSNRYLRLVAIANLIAWPAAWILLVRWLDNFIFHIDINLWIFLAAAAIVALLALLTIMIKVFQVANINPARSLKYE